MSTWSVPFKNKRTALAFKKRMSAPWMKKIKEEQIPIMTPVVVRRKGRATKRTMKPQGKFETIYTWDALGSSSLIGDDALFDELTMKAQRIKKSFDIRPIVKKHVRVWTKHALGAKTLRSAASLEALTMVQKSLI